MRARTHTLTYFIWIHFQTSLLDDNNGGGDDDVDGVRLRL
jgi:hypothetical protein